VEASVKSTRELLEKKGDIHEANVLRTGTLGSAATFAGEATAAMRARYREFGEPVYFPSMEECWRQLDQGAVDAVILGIERTGQPHHGQAIVSYGFYVVREIVLPVRCNLYVKPGTQKKDIRKIVGHGSIRQCQPYLAREFPGIPAEQHGLNSVEAGREVLAGDGSLAVVGSLSLPRILTGLEVFAESIDDGALSRWWAVAKKSTFHQSPFTLVLTGRIGPDGQLGELIHSLRSSEYGLKTIAGFPTNMGISVYDYLMTFNGNGRLDDIKNVVSRFSGIRIAGAFAD
jgi:prephenate dehydratase